MALLKKSSSKGFTIKQICVTGASGYIGFRLVGELLKQGFLIKVLTRNKTQLFPKGVDIYLGDLASPDSDLRDFLSGCDVLINCAGELHDASKMRQLHIHGLKRLLDGISRLYQVDRKFIHFVQLSSVGVYGIAKNPIEPRAISEISKIQPQGEYEVTKSLADEMVQKMSNEYYYSFTILRPSNVVGIKMPNQSFEALLRAIKDKRFFYVGSRSSISTYVHVDDVVDKETGFFCNAFDAGAFASAFFHLENEHHRSQMGDAGKARVKKEFTIEKMESNTRKVYLDALGCKE